MGRYWKCEFEGKNGESIWKFIIADTTRQANQQVFETSRYFDIEPKYETLTKATEKEVRDFKKMIKKRVKEKMQS
jgi:hypothetical protein